MTASASHTTQHDLLSKVASLIAVTAMTGALTLGVASAASAEGQRTGYASCSTLVKVESQTSGYGPSWLLVAHTTNKIDKEWAYSGYHSSLSMRTQTSWKAYTNATMSWGKAVCSGMI